LVVAIAVYLESAMLINLLEYRVDRELLADFMGG